MAEGSPDLAALTEDQVRVWSKAEDIAVHFNELIMNFRLKAVGAVTLAAGLVGTVLLNKGEAPPPQFNYYSFALAMWFLAAVWVGILALDLFYYHRLLLGAVEEAIRIEAMLGNRCQLSTVIKARAEKGPTDNVARWVFYLLPLIAMILAGVLAWNHAPVTGAAKAPAAVAVASCLPCPLPPPEGHSSTAGGPTRPTGARPAGVPPVPRGPAHSQPVAAPSVR